MPGHPSSSLRVRPDSCNFFRGAFPRPFLFARYFRSSSALLLFLTIPLSYCFVRPPGPFSIASLCPSWGTRSIVSNFPRPDARRAFTTFSGTDVHLAMSSSSVSHALSGPAYIEQEELLAILHARRRGERSLKLQILDVRDDDYTVAKLPGAINVPSEGP
ncbi:hypothetical protein NGA_0435600 [Nannochloropsis gaditana CCMP526]|uniref:uncharacterized protein n=1 Tax=Nannochloropsis gaditana (strain CCMP526) TaxID=1093141 RepID=UPI00029F6D3F|nr:hypothetical protein NGA_0435600 [Nannochloropsis gaditana CCMP526]EKU22841.1 hypothetical protein NGA_0435600 [Nannochloropsis gaditana CCMP526]|eukprot:XP_005853519.1 hypothetical protein NGA_0435600 [Nannochloropsis gaditana CCMP526]